MCVRMCSVLVLKRSEKKKKGFTVWLERKIIARLHGEAHRDLAVIFADASAFKRALIGFQRFVFKKYSC